MSKIKNIIEQNRITLQVFVISLIAIFASYSLFLQDSFVADHVYAGLLGHLTAKPAPLWYYFVGGRPMNFFYGWINYFLGFFGISKLGNSAFLQIMHMLILSAAVTTIYNLFADVSKKKGNLSLVPLALVLLCIVNPMYMDNLAYYAYEMGAAVLFAALASRQFINKKYISSFVFVLMAVCTYQNMFELFLVWTTAALFIKYEERATKKFICRFCLMAGIAVASLATNIILQKVVTTVKNRMIMADKVAEANAAGQALDTSAVIQFEPAKQLQTTSLSNIQMLIKNALCGVKIVLENVFYPGAVFEIAAIVATIILIILFIREKKKALEIIVSIAALGAINLYYIVIYLSGSVDYSGRVIWPFFACASAVFYILFLKLEKTGVKKVLTAVFTVLGALLIYHHTLYATDFYVSKALDCQIIGIVQKEIEEYEAETGIEVKTIYTRAYDDTEFTSKYLYQKYNFEAYNFNQKTYVTAWSDVQLLNYLTGEHYQKEWLEDEDYIKIFGDRSWREFNASEQLIFDGDTLYWAKF